MNLYSFRPGQSSEASMTKGGLDCPTFLIDWTQGIPSGNTLSTTTITAVNASNVDATSACVSGSSNSGNVTTATLKTCGSGGTGAATDGARFRIRFSQALSSSPRVLLFDVFVVIQNVTYDPLAVA